MAGVAGGVRAGRAYVEMGVNDAGLRAGLQAAQARVKAFGASLQSVGSKMAGLSVAMAVPLGMAAKTFADFEQQMARTRGLLGLEKTSEAFQALEAEARRLGATTVFTSGEAARAMSVFALANYDTQKILKAIGPTLNLANAGMMDVAQAADISMKVMAGMGIEASELGYTIDVLTKAMTTANTDLVMLGEAFKYVGPVAKSAGLSLEETTAAIQMLSDAGMQADMAGTTLRGAILALTSPSKEAADMLDHLRVKVTDDQKNFRSLADIIEDLQKALSGLGTGAQLEAIGAIFANRQATGIAELVSQGADKLRQRTGTLKTESAGTGERIAAVQLDTLTGSWKLFTSAVEGFALTLGAALAPALRDWGAVLTDVANVLNRLFSKNADWVPLIAKTVVGVGLLGAGLFVVGGAIKIVGSGLGLLLLPLRALPLAIGAVTASVGLLTGAVGLLLSPITLMSAAIAGGAVYWAGWTDSGQKAMGAVGDAARSTFATIKQAFGGVVNAIRSGDLALAARIAWKGLEVVWLQGVDWLKDLWTGWGDFFKGLITRVVAAVAGILSGGLVGVWRGIQAIWTNGIGLLASAWEGFAALVVSIFADAVPSVSKMFNNILYGIEVAWIEMVSVLRRVWLNLIGVLDKTLEGLASQMREVTKSFDFIGRLASGKPLIESDATTARNINRGFQSGTQAEIEHERLRKEGKGWDDPVEKVDTAAARLARSIKTLEDERAAKLADAEKRRKGVEDIISSDAANDAERKAKKRAEEDAARHREIAAAQKELADAVKEAADAVENMNKVRVPEQIGEAPAEVAAGRKQLPTGEEVRAMLLGKVEAFGMFDTSSLAQQLAGPTAQEERDQKMLELTRMMLDQIRQLYRALKGLNLGLQ